MEQQRRVLFKGFTDHVPARLKGYRAPGSRRLPPERLDNLLYCVGWRAPYLHTHAAKFSRKLANHFAPRSLRLAAFPIARILVVANSMDITAISLGRRSPSTANRAASSRQLRRHKLRLSAVQRHRRSRFDWPLREPWLHSCLANWDVVRLGDKNKEGRGRLHSLALATSALRAAHMFSLRSWQACFYSFSATISSTSGVIINEFRFASAPAKSARTLSANI